MILYKGNSILTITAILIVLANEWPVTFILFTQIGPISLINGIAHSITELKVESCTGVPSSINPVLDGIAAIPTFTYGELRFRVFIIHLGIFGTITFHHIVTESGITQIVEQELQVGLDGSLHILALVIQVTQAVPTFAGILILTYLVTFCSRFIVRAYIFIGQSVIHVFIGFCGEIVPSGQCATMVDNHIGNGTNAFILKGFYQRAQLLFAAERAVIVSKPIQGVITH